MQGLEVALIRLATTLAGTVAKSLLAPRHGAGLVAKPTRSLPGRPQTPDRLARTLGARLADAGYADLPEHERRAAVDSVTATLEGAGPLTPEQLFALELDPERLRATLSAPPDGASPRATALYGELLGLSCAHLVEQVTAQPTFPARAAVEQSRAAARTERLVRDVRERVGRRPDAEALAFEQRYADFVAETQCRMSLFGLTLGRTAREWPLDTAYISLAVAGEDTHQERFGMPDAAHAAPVSVKAEQAVCTADRTLLRGAAGSGKSTLVQWLALNAARRTFAPELADWNRCVPFVLRLRSFATTGELPTPGDFLRATGVPFHAAAPPGWADGLLHEGRALVLIDGVDEVPARLRGRTERWLRDLLVAYPGARYVITTRPSAVAEDWLAPQGFASHTLLPMERDDIHAFVRHWHDAARRECAQESEKAQLATYETALLHAVTTRRDLGRLATNPLMCALLCALNRDRRMHLPRARKELYDAALDMLLVRRDTEREVARVEGVDLTREEQTALLQRLAYWLIRNGQAEAERSEAVTMLAEWLRAMPQIDGTPEQVFAHLLIRSGLLREPAPGHIDFVHRTFQDYLGARAAVEARDFGVLVRNAHDPQWDDVVRMAVGHARTDERATLLRKVLKRADTEESAAHRLVLLAAACLEHAPELDPDVRDEVERRTAALLPPTLEDAELLAGAGELVLELLPGPEGLDEDTAAAVVRVAGLVGGDRAFELIGRFQEDGRWTVARQRGLAWEHFGTEEYAREVLATSAPGTASVPVTTAEQLHALRHLPDVQRVILNGPHSDLAPLLVAARLDTLFLWRNSVLSDLSPLAGLPSLRSVSLHTCTRVADLSPLSGPGLTILQLADVSPGVSLEPLRDMPGLEQFVLHYPALIESLEELPIGPRLHTLRLSREVRFARLDGIERWEELRFLALGGGTQLRRLPGFPSLARLTGLAVHLVEDIDIRAVTHLAGLELLRFGLCGPIPDLSPLRELPALTTLELNGCAMDGPPIDLAPLADLDRLTVHLTEDSHITGTDHIPPERLVRR
ncbi:NACHT domain-containing protein [Streptomyces iconiensis]|uniref:NACHT domain-containing protein n=1 Tax=Streptomyces iconiensis TaxID=1384038 RepID=A0ABT7A7W6_9ACTN|nr:NACHT domain-containing protein [Streptomyces iconiensis]MDJ1137434.1 NACHT domain-containing protein [Streptomyces iconiensis]